MSLSRFLPLTLRRHLAESRDLDEPLYLEGATLFADISGFTPLSEALARMGREGAETLTRTLNGYFTAVIAAIESNGGDVMRFAGDAVTAFFSDPGGQEQALTAAHAIQAFMGSHPETVSPVGSFPIRIKVGIAAGEHVLLTVGEGRARDYVFAGHPVDGSAEAEHHAGPGEIVVKAKQLKVRSSKFKVEAVKPGFWRVLGPQPSAFSLQPSAFSLQPSASEAACAPFLHPILVERLAQGSERMMNEHRRAAVLFVSFPGVDDYRDRAAVGRLRAFYAEARAAVDRHEGNLNKVDMGDKGSKFLITFGAPLSHEDDADRAVHFALDLKTVAGARGLPLAIGLNRGTIFAGLIGDNQRCEYTVMGDEVNLAARLMQAAGSGRILAGPGIHAECRAFAFDALPPVTLKGKSQPVPVFEPQSTETGEKTDTESFVGRVPELNACEAFIRQAGDDPRLLLVKGEAGIGKSAFLSHLFRERLSDRRIVSGWCREFTSQFPYHPWKFILRRLLELGAPEGTDPAEAWRTSLQATVPELVPFAPILLDLLQLPHTLPPVAIDEQTRKAILHRQAGLLVRAAAGREALSLSLTDVQWMDPESGGLLADLLRTSDKPSPVFVLSGRELPGGLQEMASSHSLTLGPLPEPDLKKSALAFLRVQRAPDKLLADAAAASSGNPLLLQETLRAYLEAGYVTRDTQNPELLFLDETRKPSLPTTLEGVVMARFDRLPADRQAILKALSVFGDSIPWEVARRAATDTGNDPALLEALVGNGEFITRQGPEGFCVFPQSHIRSTIYDSLDFNSRRDLHCLAARIFRDALPTEAPETIQTVAFHFLQADAAMEGKDFLLRAGRAAYDAYALPSALHYYQALIAHRDQLEDEAISSIAFAQGSILLKMGRFEEIQTLLAPSLLEHIPQGDEQARLLLLLADACRLTGVVNMADTFLERASMQCCSSLQTFQVQISRGTLLAQTGQLNKALELFQNLISTYRRQVPEIELLKIASIFGPLLFATGERDRATAVLDHARKKLLKRNEPQSLIKLMHNLGTIWDNAGNHKKALRAFLSSLQNQEKYGIYQYQCTTISEVGYESMLIGNWSNAEYYYQLGLRIATKLKDPIQIQILCNMSELDQYKGNFASAKEHLDAAGAASERFCFRHLEVLFYWLEFWANLPYPIIMGRLLQRLDRQMRESHTFYIQHLCEAYSAQYYFQTGQARRARQAAEEVLNKLDIQKQPKEAYLAYKVLFLLAHPGYDHPDQLMQIAKATSLSQYWLEAAVLVSGTDYDSDLMKQADIVLHKTPFANLAWKCDLLKARHHAAQGPRRSAKRYAAKAQTGFDRIMNSIPWRAARKYFSGQSDAVALRHLNDSLAEMSRKRR